MQNEAHQSLQAVMDSIQFPQVNNGLQKNQIIGTNLQPLPRAPQNQLPYQFPPPYQTVPQVQQPNLTEKELHFHEAWATQLQKIRAPKNFKNHDLPLARIKKIMKADNEVKMIAAETPALFSEASELFILQLTHLSSCLAEHHKRKTLLKSDIHLAIAKHEMYLFLRDIVPVEAAAKEGAVVAAAAVPKAEELNQAIPCLYDPSKFGPLKMNDRHPEMVPHGSEFALHE